MDHDLLIEGARNLRDYFQSEGYFEAQVEFKPQNVVNDKADIDFLINTGKRHKLVGITIQGNKYFTTDAIRERMFLQTATCCSSRTAATARPCCGATRIIAQPLPVQRISRCKGHCTIEDNYRGKASDIACPEFVEGPQYLQQLDVEGMATLDKARIVSQLSSDEGQPFSEYNVAVDRDAILERYFEKGFPMLPSSGAPSRRPIRIKWT